MKRVGKEHVCYSMSAENAPALRVGQGALFRLETKDCYSDNLRTTADTFTKDMWDTVNPATGPVYVEGARPGDVLCVEIAEIATRDFAVMCVEKGAGALGDRLEGVETSIYPIEDGKLALSDDVSVPIRPMIGVIGVAPEGDAILTGAPGEHGGNMDCKEITAGATVYLPVNVEGALLAAGDIHAVMGDGEVCICGAEASGEITMRARAIQSNLPTPCVETDDAVHFIGSALTLDGCERIVLNKAHAYLTGLPGLSANAAARIMSLIGDLRVCQVVDPLKTMRFSIPKWFLRTRG